MSTKVSNGFRRPLGDGTLTEADDGDSFHVGRSFGDLDPSVAPAGWIDPTDFIDTHRSLGNSASVLASLSADGTKVASASFADTWCRATSTHAPSESWPSMPWSVG